MTVDTVISGAAPFALGVEFAESFPEEFFTGVAVDGSASGHSRPRRGPLWSMGTARTDNSPRPQNGHACCPRVECLTKT